MAEGVNVRFAGELQKFIQTKVQNAGHLHIGEQAVRYNLKRLEELHIITRISDKIRDRNAIYRFADQ